MLPPEPRLSRPVPPLDPQARLASAGLDAAEVARVGALLAEGCLDAVRRGGALWLPLEVGPALGASAGVLLAAGVLEEGPGGLVVPDGQLRISFAAEALAALPELPDDDLAVWLDRGWDGLGPALAAALVRRGDWVQAEAWIRWLAQVEAPVEAELLTAHLEAGEAVVAAAQAHGGPLPEEVWSDAVSTLLEKWAPGLPLATWAAVAQVVGGLAALPASPGPEVRQVLRPLFVQVAQMAAGADPDDPATAYVWYLKGLLLEVVLAAADVDPVLMELALLHSGGVEQGGRALVEACLRAPRPSVESTRWLDRVRPHLHGPLVDAWLEARAHTDPADASAVIERLAGDTSPLPALIAARALRPNPALTTRLAELAASPDAEVAEAAARALGAAAPAPLVEALRARLDGPEPARGAAALALAALDREELDAQVAPVLLAHLARWLDDGDADGETGGRLIRALGRRAVRGDEARWMLVSALERPALRPAALLALDEASVGRFVWEDERPWLREASAEWRRGLAERCMAEIDAQPGPIQRLLVRIAAFNSRGEDAEIAVALLNLVAAGEAWERIQLLPAVGAAQVRVGSVVQRLLEGLEHEDPYVNMAACEGLGLLIDGFTPDNTILEGHPEVAEALLGAVRVGDVAVSMAAARALWRLSRQRVAAED